MAEPLALLASAFPFNDLLPELQDEVFACGSITSRVGLALTCHRFLNHPLRLHVSRATFRKAICSEGGPNLVDYSKKCLGLEFNSSDYAEAGRCGQMGVILALLNTAAALPGSLIDEAITEAARLNHAHVLDALRDRLAKAYSGAAEVKVLLPCFSLLLFFIQVALTQNRDISCHQTSIESLLADRRHQMWKWLAGIRPSQSSNGSLPRPDWRTSLHPMGNC